MSHPHELFSIVILGAMNPPIHHPLWYGSVGLLTEPEVQRASAAPDLVVTPMFGHFSLGTIEVSCLQQRWAVQTVEEAEFQRVLEIAKKTMDVLEHTPVSAIGINFDYARSANVQNVAALLARHVQSLDLGFDGGGGAKSATVAFSHSRPAGIVTATTTQSVAPDPTDPTCLLAKYNLELKLVPQAFQPFSMSQLLDDHVPAAREQSVKYLERTLAAMTRAGS